MGNNLVLFCNAEGLPEQQQFADLPSERFIRAAIIKTCKYTIGEIRGALGLSSPDGFQRSDWRVLEASQKHYFLVDKLVANERVWALSAPDGLREIRLSFMICTIVRFTRDVCKIELSDMHNCAFRS